MTNEEGREERNYSYTKVSHSGGFFLPAVLCASLAVLCAVVSLIFFYINGRNEKERIVLYFSSLDSSRLCSEARYVPKNPPQGREALFVSELLLGPMTNRFIPLFANGTTLDFCMVQNDVLYVGLSKEALNVTAKSADIKSAVDLLQYNIVRKFTKINTVLVYIDGKSVYENGQL